MHRDLKPENIVVAPGGSGQDRGLRHRLAGRSGTHPPGQAHARRRDDRHAGLHGARAAHGPERRRPHRHLRVRRHPRRDAVGPAPAERRRRRPGARERTPEDDVLAGLLQRIADRCRQTSTGQAGAHDARELVARLDGMAGAVGVRPAPRSRRGRSARFWWEFHQGAAAVSYVAMLVPAWFARATDRRRRGSRLLHRDDVRGRHGQHAAAAPVVHVAPAPDELPWARRRSAAVDPPRRHPRSSCRW